MNEPTLDDARRAADEMVAAGVSTVLLFGSLARGDARNGPIRHPHAQTRIGQIR